MSVKFTTLEAADECVRLMNGRFFGGRQLAAAKWDGYTNLNVKVGGWTGGWLGGGIWGALGAGAHISNLPPVCLFACLQVQETEEEQQARLERFAAELEAGGAAGAEPAEQ